MCGISWSVPAPGLTWWRSNLGQFAEYPRCDLEITRKRMTELSATSVYHEADARHCLSVSIARRLLIRPGNSQVHIAGCNFRRLYLLAERHSVTGLQSMVANQLASLLPSGESRAAVVAR